MKKALWIIIAAAVVFGGWRYLSKRDSSSSLTPTPSKTPVAVKDTTDSSLNADAAALDKEMLSISSDLSAVDQGLADSPVPQVQ